MNCGTVSEKKATSAYTRAFVVIAILVVVVSIVLGENLFSYGPQWINRLRTVVTVKWFHLVCTAGIAVLGVVLYFFRSRQQKLYGLAECAFALVTAWNAADTSAALGQINYLALLAAAYLMVRGLTHFGLENSTLAPRSFRKS